LFLIVAAVPVNNFFLCYTQYHETSDVHCSINIKERTMVST